MTRHTLLLLAASLVGLSALGCRSPGQVKNGLSAPEFAAAGPLVYVEGPAGLVRLRADGSERQVLLPRSYGVHDLSPDGSRFAVDDPSRSLYFWTSSGLAFVPETKQRVEDVAFSPDGKTAAILRVADPNPSPLRKQAKYLGDEVLLVDTQTLKTTEIPGSDKGKAVRVDWSKDGATLWLKYPDKSAARVDLKSRARTPETAWPDPGLLHQGGSSLYERCPVNGAELRPRGPNGDQGVSLVREGKESPLVEIEGRRRGRGEKIPTTWAFTFSRDCRFALFSYDFTIWLVEVESGKAAPLEPGWRAFFSPT